MDDHPSRESLQQLLDAPDQLSDAEYQALERHLENCELCRDSFERLLHEGETEKWCNLLGSSRPKPVDGPRQGVSYREVVKAKLAKISFPPSQEKGSLGQLDEFRILQELGYGAMGDVFQARNERLGHLVAIKVLKPELAAVSSCRARFEREGRRAAAIKHDHVVTVYQAGSTPGIALPYLVMEYIEGETLHDHLQRQHVLAPRDAAEIARQVALGLAAAHDQGVIHRDIKPSNILLEKHTSRAKITDFGLARAIDGSDAISQSEVIVGTSFYMSPEQIQSPKQVDKPSDVFSLGVVLYQMLTGERPFRGITDPVIMQQIVHEEPIPPRKLNDAIDRDLETITLKCLAKEPAQRYQTAQELADDLQRWLKGEPIRARPVGLSGKFWRWCRRKPAQATTSGVAAAAIVAVTVVSLAFALYQVQVGKQRMQALYDSQLRSSTLAFDRGLELCEKGEIGPGMHWLARSLELAPTDQKDLLRVIRVNLAGWRSHLSPLRAYLPHQAKVTLAAFSPDGRRFLTGASDKTVRLWNIATGQQTAVLPHEHQVQVTAFSPDGTFLVTGTTEGAVRLWETATGQFRADLPHRHRDGVQTVAFSPNGRTILTGGADGKVWLWDVATPDRPRFQQPFLHKGAVVAAAFSPNGQKVLTGSHDATACLWDVATGKECLGSPLRHGNEVWSVAFSPDGDTVATGSADGTARLWVAATGRLLEPSLEHRRGVTAVAFSRDGQIVATASADWTAQLWNTATRQPLSLPLLHPGRVTGVRFSPDSKTIVTWGTDNNVRVWEVLATQNWLVAATPKPVGSLLHHQGEVRAVAFSPDGRSILTGSRDGFARLWDSPSATPPGLSLTNRLPVTAVAFSPDGRTALTGTEGRRPEFWDVATGQPLDLKGQPIGPVEKELLDRAKRGLNWLKIPLPQQHSASIRALAISPDGRIVLTGSTDFSARLWDRTTGQSDVLSPAHQDFVEAVAIDSRTAVTASRDGTARLWDVATRRELPGSPLRHDGAVVAVALSPDGTTVVTGSHGGTAHLWEAATGRERSGSPLRHQSKVLAVAFNGDSTKVVTGTEDGTALLWDAATGKPFGQPLRHEGAVMAVVFSPNGRHVLTAGMDKMARLWDAATGLPAAPPLQHHHWVRCVAFSPDGKVILTGSEDRTARLWDTATGKPYGPPIEHRREVMAVAFSPDGRVVLTGSADRSDRSALLSEVPTAVEAEPERIALWVGVLTGMELDDNGVFHSLSAEDWHQRKRRLADRSGAVLP
jgi:WD40 repeat protein